MDRVILHLDANNYFASVESIGHPELQTIPMAVASQTDGRHGIIVAKNYPAKALNIRTAESVLSARKKCPKLLLIQADHAKYSEYSRRINAIYDQYTDLAESFSIDETWLDVTGSSTLFGDGKRIADELRERIRREIGITISVGVSFNKLFAKLGSDYKKPDATTVISRENFPQILYPLPADAMMYVGKSAAAVLARAGITTIGDIARTTPQEIVRLLGRFGETIRAYSLGLDDSPVRRRGDTDPVKSIGNGITFPRDLIGLEDIRGALLTLSDTVAARCRAAGVRGTTIQVQIKDPALHMINRQATLPEPTNATLTVYHTALDIAIRAWNPVKPIRMMSVTVTNFHNIHAPEQLSFWPKPESANPKLDKLDHAVDDVRRKYGSNKLTYGRSLMTDFSASDEEDPDR